MPLAALAAPLPLPLPGPPCDALGQNEGAQFGKESSRNQSRWSRSQPKAKLRIRVPCSFEIV